MYFSRIIKISLKNLRSYCDSSIVKWSSPNGNPTNLHIYHTITKKKEQFTTKSLNSVTWYICGPTVYDSAHIGHASTFVRFDIIRRILEKFLSKNVIQVMCITDIDDKIIARSQEKNVDWKTLATSYEKEFFSDLISLNVSKPLITARATDFIPQMLHFIENLENKNLAYKGLDGSIYFDSLNYNRPGKFQEMQRTEMSSFKKCSADFALWKAVKPGEPFWNSSWGPGRPGWHIECSTIASYYFGNSLDLHSGGLDLIFPHHENEETQSCAFHDVDQWVNYWIHAGYLLLPDNQKMSKSLKNAVSIQEFLKSYSSNHFRMLCCMMNYRKSIDYCDEILNTSIKYYEKFLNFFDNCSVYMNSGSNSGNVDRPKLLKILEETKRNVISAVLDDFDTETVLAELFHLIKETNTMIFSEDGNGCLMTIAEVNCYVKDILTKLGFDFLEKNVNSLTQLENIVDSSVLFRNNVREVAIKGKKQKSDVQVTSNKLLQLCDQFREDLLLQGISVKDRKNNKSTWTFTDSKTMSEKIK